MKYVGIAVLLLLLAGCGGDPQPRFSPGPTVSSPTTTAPAVETPQEFLRRWYRVSDQMELTGNTKAFDAMHLKSCKGCDVYSANVRAIYGAHRRIRGSETSVLSVRRIRGALWEVRIKAAPSRILDAKGARLGGYPGGPGTLRLALVRRAGGWLVRSEIRVVR